MCEYLSIIARDISEMKRAELALQESERFHRSIVDAADIGIWIIDSENRTRFVNSKMTKLLSCKAEQIIGEPIVSFMDAEGVALAKAQQEALRNGVEALRDFKLCRKDGAELWVRLATSPLFDEHDQFLGTLALVTESTTLRQPVGQIGQ